MLRACCTLRAGASGRVACGSEALATLPPAAGAGPALAWQAVYLARCRRRLRLRLQSRDSGNTIRKCHLKTLHRVQSESSRASVWLQSCLTTSTNHQAPRGPTHRRIRFLRHCRAQRRESSVVVR